MHGNRPHCATPWVAKYSGGVSDPRDEATDDATEWLTELLYTGVGLGILAINRIQVARRSAEKHLHDKGVALPSNPGLDAISELVGDPEKLSRVLEKLKGELADLDNRLDGLDNRFVDLLSHLEPELPDAARDLSAALRRLTNQPAAQLRSLLGLEAR